ncbi:kinase-like domain-containing protein, partial [Lactarius hatsudake]
IHQSIRVHSNIVTLDRTFETSALLVLVLVLEFVPGQGLCYPTPVSSLIASMFAQMCEAVATCHDASVFHRNIKPENFMVTDGWTLNQDGIREREVVVKLCDFGLSTRDAVSSDMHQENYKVFTGGFGDFEK